MSCVLCVLDNRSSLYHSVPSLFCTAHQLMSVMTLTTPLKRMHLTFEVLIDSVNKHAGLKGYAVVKAHIKTYFKTDLIHKMYLLLRPGPEED